MKRDGRQFSFRPHSGHPPRVKRNANCVMEMPPGFRVDCADPRKRDGPLRDDPQAPDQDP